MKTRLYASFFVLSFGIAIPLVLSKLATGRNQYPNNFKRVFPNHVVEFYKAIDLKFNSFYIAGMDSRIVYLGNTTGFLHLVKVNMETGSTQDHLMKSPLQQEMQSGIVTVDSPKVYLTDRLRRMIFWSNVNIPELSLCAYKSAPFVDALPVTESLAIVRTTKDKVLEYTLARKTAYPPFQKMMPSILEKQSDGLFCTDGMLDYDQLNGHIIYTYYYRNQFICMDTNLNLLYRGKTIDTISRAQVKVAKIFSANEITFSAPPLIVNKKTAVYDKRLYINSGLLADNETKADFDQSAVIDVYDLKTGMYLYSFYLPNYKHSKIRCFKIFKEYLSAIYDHYMVLYKIRQVP